MRFAHSSARAAKRLQGSAHLNESTWITPGTVTSSLLRSNSRSSCRYQSSAQFTCWARAVNPAPRLPARQAARPARTDQAMQLAQAGRAVRAEGSPRAEWLHGGTISARAAWFYDPAARGARAARAACAQGIYPSAPHTHPRHIRSPASYSCWSIVVFKFAHVYSLRSPSG